MGLSFLLLTILSSFSSSTLSQGSEIHPGEGIADLLSDLTLWIVTLDVSLYSMGFSFKNGKAGIK